MGTVLKLGRRFKQEISVYQRVLKDDRAPRFARWLLGLAVIYALLPIDLIPDFIPVVGHLDDLIIVPLLFWLAVRLVPAEILAEHRKAIAREDLFAEATPSFIQANARES